MLTTTRISGAALCLAVLTLCGAAAAQPGVLDPSFGFGGKVLVPEVRLPSPPLSISAPFPYSAVARGQGAATLSDGKILVAGTLLDDFALSRLLENGSPDAAFGTGGLVTTDIAGGFAECLGLAVQGDGKIILAGHNNKSRGGTDADVVVVRYLSDGTLDTSFNGTGKVILDLQGTSDDKVAGVALQSDGKIVVAGTSHKPFGTTRGVLLRFTADGALDATFNETGKVYTDFGRDYTLITSLAVQKDNHIVLAGSVNRQEAEDILVARFTADGALDLGFNERGYVITDIYLYDRAEAMAVRDDGRIVITGYAGDPATNGHSLAVLRYLPTGNLDASFNQTGKVLDSLPERSSKANGLVLQRDGKVVVAGYSGLYAGGTTGTNFILRRYQRDGALDLDFGVNGMALTDFDTASDGANKIIQQPDGKLLVVGGSFKGNNTGAIAVARYENNSAHSAAKVAVHLGAGTESVPLNNGDSLYFDGVGPGGHGSKTFTIQNIGGLRLVFLRVATNPPEGPVAFTVQASEVPTLLEPGETATFSVDYDPQTTAASAVNVLVLSSDQQDSSFAIKLGGQPLTVSLDGVASTYLEDAWRGVIGGRLANTQITIPVRLSAPAATAIAVPIMFSGSAERGKDFNVNSLKATFAPGQTVYKLLVTLIGNSVAQPDRSVRIELGPPLSSVARLSTRSFAEFTIVDNDRRVEMDGVPLNGLLSLGDPFACQINTSGSAPINLRWTKNGASFPVQSPSILDLGNVTLADAGRYTLIASNPVNTVTSPSILIAVLDGSPKTVQAVAGASVTFNVTAAGPGLSYRWLRNGLPIPNATGRAYTIAKVQPADGENIYICRVTMVDGGDLDSGARRIIVTAAAPTLNVPSGGSLPRGAVGVPYTYQISVSGDSPNGASSYKVTGLPAGLTVNTETGLISGTPKAPTSGPKALTITASNPKGDGTVHATLVIDPLPDNISGSYFGKVEHQPLINGNLGGRFDMVVTQAGAYTGKFALGADMYFFSGTVSFSNGGDPAVASAMAEFVLPRPGKSSLTVSMSFDPTHNRLDSCTLTDNTLPTAAVATFTGLRNVWSSSRPASVYKGHHTFYGEPIAAPATGVPQGHSYGSVTIQEATGMAILTGKLADGSPWTNAAPISEGGYLPIFQSLYTPGDRGSICGHLSVSTAANQNLDGLLRWKHGANAAANAKNFPLGFDFNLEPVGGLYTPPVSPKVALGLEPGTLNAHLDFLDVERGSETQNLSIGTSSRVTFPAEVKTTLMIVAQTGLISGVYTQSSADPLHPGQTLTHHNTYSGVIVQGPLEQAEARGFYVTFSPLSPDTVPPNRPLLQSNAVKLSRN